MTNLSKSDLRLAKLIAERQPVYQKRKAEIEQAKIKRREIRAIKFPPPIYTPDERIEMAKEKLKSKIKKKNGCWVWQGLLTENGYGFLVHNKKKWRAHRLSYTLFAGPIKDGLLVCHKCDEPRCINPSHLFLGTPKQNMQDCISKGRHRSGGAKKTVRKKTLTQPLTQPKILLLF